MANTISGELATVNVGHSLPALDFFPFFLAHALGYFEDQGVTVRTVFDSHRERPIKSRNYNSKISRASELYFTAAHHRRTFC